MSRETSMYHLIDILERMRSGAKKKTIAYETQKDIKMIRRFFLCAQKNGWLDTAKSPPSEKEIADTFYARKKHQQHILDNHRSYIQSCIENAKQDSDLTIEGIHRLVKDKISAECDLADIAPEVRPQFSESTFRRYVQKHFPKTRTSTVKRKLSLGTMEVDFGDIGSVVDDMHGEMVKRKAYIFVARLRYSRKMYVSVVLDQNAHTFARSHTEAFDHFGGVPLECIPDNTKSAVINCAFGETQLNRIYHDLASHYGFKVNPCRPYAPNQKGGVENGVKYVKRSCIAVARQKERDLGNDLPRLSVIKKEVASWLQTICDTHIVQGVHASVNNLFSEEVLSLKPLPFEQWEPLCIATWKVGSNCRVRFDKNTYAVPESCIGSTVEIRAKSKQIRIILHHETVAIHERVAGTNRDIVGSVNLGARYDAYVAHTDEQALAMAESIGQKTKIFIAVMLNNSVLNCRREAFGIVIGLRKKYGAVRIEHACTRALFYESEARYKTIKNILEQHLDQKSLALPLTAKNEQVFRFMKTIHLYVLIISLWRIS